LIENAMRRVEESHLSSSGQDEIVLLAPLTGPVVPLAEVPDPVFSAGMSGDGIGIDPLACQLVAPCGGVVSHLARTGHAVTLTTSEGAAVLLHIGIDTVGLNGKGFALLGVQPSATGRMVDRLVGVGLIDRLPHPKSRRELLATLTKRGREVVRQVTAHRRAEIAGIVEQMPATERRGASARADRVHRRRWPSHPRQTSIAPAELPTASMTWSRICKPERKSHQ
jgi:glucose-specific phosphotransferase system IIA component